MNDCWKIGNLSVAPADWGKGADDFDTDPRGLLFVYEKPIPTATYVIATDPTVGKTGWNRYARVDDDKHIDNATIEVIRRGTGGNPDVQAAEYAAPIDAVELAPILNALGRIYCGNAEDGQALMIGDVVGPGAVTLRELIDRFNYTNHFMWKYYGQAGNSVAGRGQKLWWPSSRSVNKDLWMRGMHHMHKGRIRIYSEYLVEEMADCVADAYLLIGEARHGKHDDRLKCLLYGIWALHDWSFDDPMETSPVEVTEPKNLQRCDVSYEDMARMWSEHVDAMLEN